MIVIIYLLIMNYIQILYKNLKIWMIIIIIQNNLDHFIT